MSEEEKKAIEHFKNYPKNWDFAYEIDKKAIEIVLNLISKLQKEVDKKDKVIDLAIKNLNQLGGMYHLKAKDNTYSSRNVETVKMTSEEIKEYFYKKVEEENE